MGKVNYIECDGLDERSVACENRTLAPSASWISVNTRGERFDYCSPSCFRSFVVQLKRLFPGVV